MPKYLVNVQTTYTVEAATEQDVYMTERGDWQVEDSDVMVVCQVPDDY